MVNLKKYNGFLKLFVIFLTLFSTLSCSKQIVTISRIEGKLVPVVNTGNQVSEIDDFIKPYREHINKDLNTVLAYCPETLDKSSGKWQTTIGNLLSDVTLSQGNRVFKSREKKDIDICMLNSGGIRSVLPKGDVTARTAFEIMPFENSLVVIALKGEQITELVNYFIADKKSHPLSGMSFFIDKNGNARNILIQEKALDSERIYYVATNDYLANGGDNMTFFAKGVQKYDLNYKLRDILIDYFKEVDTVAVPKDIRITQE